MTIQEIKFEVLRMTKQRFFLIFPGYIQNEKGKK